MCGIAGVVEKGASIGEREAGLRRMAGLLRHRGPDDTGTLIDGEAGLAHRRLSIIDLSGGHQPMRSEDGSLAITFNGEIYNFPEVRADLEQLGYAFRTRSDTEVILHAYRAWGTDALPRLNGMFAFAIWDASRRRLFAARDRLGKKPLFYHHGADRLLFASEMKAILAYGGVDREIDHEALDEFLSTTYIGAPRTIFRHVRKLLPGHYLLHEGGALTLASYWSLTFRPSDPPRGEEECLEALEEKFRAAVRRRLISDVPLGAFLSGGVDSSAVVGMMAQLTDQPVRTFTIGFEERDHSEIEDARVIARHFGTNHHEFFVRPSAIGILPELVWHFDEPFGDSSAVPTYYVSKMAAEQVKVVLSGDGGDEVFAGYTRYQGAIGRHQGLPLPRWFRRGVLGPLSQSVPIGWPGRNRLVAMSRFHPLAPGYDLGIYPYVKERLYSAAMRAELREAPRSDAVEEFAGRLRPLDRLSRLQYLDTLRYLPEDILTKVDRASMAHSLEVRAPLLDFELVEFAATLPPSLKLRGGVSKYLFKKLLAKYLPPSVFEKPKQGFAIPQGAWFQRELRAHAREVLLDPRTRARGYFEPGAIERILRCHDAGERDYGTWIWCLLVLEEWHRIFIDADTRRV